MKRNQYFITVIAIILAYASYGQAITKKTFMQPSINEFEAVSLGSVTFLDVNNDNYQDILITGQSSERIAKLYLNNGNGEYSEVLNTPFVGVYLSSVAFADIDNDNDKDVLITGMNNSNQGTTKLYLNDGNGVFIENTITPFVNVERSSIAFADIDNDNDQDVLITGYHNGYIAKMYVNDGIGNFTELLGTPFEGVRSSAIIFIDIDNDNYKDVLITGENDNKGRIAKLYKNEGLGNFTEIIDTPFDGVREGSVAFADIDNDNDKDILISGKISDSYSTPTAYLYQNDGNGNYTKLYENFTGVYTSAVAFCDFDNDNDQDVLITGDASYPGFNSVTHLYKNNGSGNYTKIENTPFDGVRESSVSFADVDNDGYQDLLISGTVSNSNVITKLYYNINEIVESIPPNTIADNYISKTILYPNPTKGTVNLTLDETLKKVYINIRDINGKIIEKKYIENQKAINLYITGGSGIYFLEIISKNNKTILKVVKN